MADPRDIEPESADLRAIDLVYGDLDDSEREKLEGAAEGDPELSGDIEAYGSLRQLFRDLPEEEPPTAISAQLLQAAAREAPSPPKEEGEGFLARLRALFATLSAHPGMAAAASLVVVAGVAGTLYVTGKGKVAQPGASEANHTLDRSGGEGELSVPAAQPGPGALPAAGEVAGEAAEAATVVDEADGEAEEWAPSATDKSTDVPRSSSRARALRPEPKKKKPRAKSSAGSKNPYQPFGGKTSGRGGGGYAPAEDRAKDDRDEGAREAESAPGSPPPEPEAQEQKSSSSDSELRALYDRAQTAANRRDCDGVRSAGNRIRKLDSQFYDTVFLRNAAIAACYQK